MYEDVLKSFSVPMTNRIGQIEEQLDKTQAELVFHDTGMTEASQAVRVTTRDIRGHR